MARKLKKKRSWIKDASPGDPLTPREREVVRLLSLGCSIFEVGAILGISSCTVDNTRTRAMRKLGATKASTMTRAVIKAKISGLHDKLTTAERRKMKGAR